MSLDNYHLSFLKSLYSADTGVGANNGFGVTSSSVQSSPTAIESLLEPFGLHNSQADFAAALAQLTGHSSAKSMDRQQSTGAAIQRPSSFTTSSLFSNTPSSEFGNPLGAPGTPIGTTPTHQNMMTPGAGNGSGGVPPPKNPKLYKTELCRSWMDHGRCNYGERCQYAHGELEKRPVPRHPKYKTEACQSFHQSGYCPYGPRCHFIHNESPVVPSQFPTPVSTPVSQPTPPSLYASQYHNVHLKSGQQPTSQTAGAPNNTVLQRVYSLPNGGYGSAGESPACSSNDSGSESPNGSFSPGLDLEDTGPFSSGFLSASPLKQQKQAAPRVQTNRFLSYDQSSINDNQFSSLLNDICQWNIEDSLSTPFTTGTDCHVAPHPHHMTSGFTASNWSAEDVPVAPHNTTTTPGRLPVFAQLSNPQ